MAKVYFTTDLKKLALLINKLTNFSPGDKVAIKLHVGEKGNKNYIRPIIAETIVNELKKKKAEPFLFDTLTMYPGSRSTVSGHLGVALEHGFDFCEIKIGKEGTKVKTKGLLKEVEVAKDLREANGVIVLSHVKGHDLAGYGGAIKNLGMGGVPAEEKGRIHDSSKPVLDLKKCVGCGLCAPLCINKAIKIINGKMKIVGDCFGCGLCIRNCPQQALKPKLALFPKLLTEAACAVLKNFKKRKVIFVNVLEKISKMCDCAKTSEIICPDIGILVSDDVVAIEQASVDLINKKTGKDLFFQLHKISPNEQIDEAEKLGLGERKYRLEKL